ncbi:MAG: hypothetical protein ABJO01_08795 [Parasphingorhabdus sp.]|uniref:hypothetical protein n=1 Tax=Parasphingorhabdus sp. TaxID=2709688 RepID=UPI003296F102
MSSHVELEIVPEEVVIDGQLLLRAHRSDDDFPAKASVILFDPDRNRSLTLTMTAGPANGKTTLALSTKIGGVVSEISSPDFLEHDERLTYKIWARPNQELVIQLGDFGYILANPFKTGFDLKLACAGSGSFRIKAAHQIFDERQEMLLSQVDRPKPNAGPVKVPKNQGEEPADAPILGSWHLSHDSGFKRNGTETFKIFKYEDSLATRMDGKLVTVQWDGNRINFERRVQLYIRGQTFGPRHIFTYSGELSNGLLSGEYRYKGTEKVDGPQAPMPQSVAVDNVKWFARRKKSSRNGPLNLDDMQSVVDKFRGE